MSIGSDDEAELGILDEFELDIEAYAGKPRLPSSAEEAGWTIELQVEQEALKLHVPFRSGDLSCALRISYQRVTYLLGQIGWPSSTRALLRDGRRARRWLPVALDRDLIDDRWEVSCWTDLHEDDQRKTWDCWGHQVG